jgi:LmbE family N-acetylglucosaminyl deacetylase
MSTVPSASEPKQSVAFVVAHPDDVAHIMGGTALLLKDRYKLHVICASRGERGYHWTGSGPVPPSAELAAVREKEERAACDILDASLTFLGLLDGEIYAGRQVVGRVADMLREIRPIALFTLGPQEKPDHAAAYLIALQALHLAKLFWEVELYMPLFNNETRQGRYADLYVNITSVIEQKRAMIACHRSQDKDAEAVEHMLSRNVLLGKLAWCDYAEAYMTGLPLMARRWNRKAGSILMGLER